MRKLNSRLLVDFISEKGIDPIHKTYIAYTPLDSLLCLAVAESYDEDRENESARLAVEAVLTAFEKTPSMKHPERYLTAANEQVLLHSTNHKLKVSIAVCITDYTRMRYAVCGNVKLHVFYEGLISMSSEVQTGSEAHNVYEYLGSGKHPKVYVSPKIPLQEGSGILFTTANIWSAVSDVEFLDAYEDAKNSRELLGSIEELLLSRQLIEFPGSYTMAVLSVEKTYKEDVMKIKKRRKLLILIGIILAALMLIGGIMLCSVRASDRRKMTVVEKTLERGEKYVGYGNYEKSLEEYKKASQLAAKLNLQNWQYKERKTDLIEETEDQVVMLTTLLDAEMALKQKQYAQAEKLYQEVVRFAVFQEETQIEAYAQEKLRLVRNWQEILNLISLGDLYEIGKDHENALKEYQVADQLLKEVKDSTTRAEVQQKIFDINALKTMSAQEEKTAQKEQEEEKQAAETKDMAVRIQAMLVTGNKCLTEGDLESAEGIYRSCFELYGQITSATGETEKAYEGIVILEQAIAEAKIKKAEDERKTMEDKAKETMVFAAEEADGGDLQRASELYQEALVIYEDLNQWEEAARIQEKIEKLEIPVDASAEVKEGPGYGL